MGQRDGHGHFSRGNYSYVGDWKDGERHGLGKERMPSGEIYDGNFEGNQRNGIGTSTCTLGGATKRVSGEWKNNLQHGFCKEVSVDGVVVIATKSDGRLQMNE